MRVPLAPDALVEVSDKGSTITIHDAIRGGALVYHRSGLDWASDHGSRPARINIDGDTLRVDDEAIGVLIYTGDAKALLKLLLMIQKL